MRYDYICNYCHFSQEREHPMGENPRVLCPKCYRPMHRRPNAPQLMFSRWGSRTVRHPATPSNAEYQAYKEWEKEGGQPGSPAREKFLRIKGEKDDLP